MINNIILERLKKILGVDVILKRLEQILRGNIGKILEGLK